MNESPNGFRAPLVEELAPLFPSYQILSLIAVGGMGAVYHAIQTSLEREVAIKILPVEFGDDAEFCESFKAEAKAMAKFIHPNLISVFDFGEVNEMLFIVMEYVPGESLHHGCHGHALDPAEAVRLMTGISQGLAHAHKHGILHRDIKPANILLDSDLEPKIGDFGLARPVDVQVQEGEAIYGTPGYTAPEVLETPQSIDQRADIFSLGVLLHELLTGLIPESDLRPPSAISQCDPRFDAVVQKATHPDPSQRYQFAEEITEELEKIASTAGPRLLQTTAPTAGAGGPLISQGYSQQPQPKKSGAGMLMLMLLITGLGVLFIFRDEIFNDADENSDPAPVAEKKPEPVEPEPAPVVDTNPKPLVPEPSPVVEHKPVPVKPDPEPLVPEPAPVVEHKPDPVTPPPAPVVSQPKFDVDAFFAHARSVMIKRSSPDITKRDEALEKNLADFKSEAWRATKRNLQERWHRAAEKELGEFVDACKQDGNRLKKKLEKPLKYKAWIVSLHEQHLDNEAKIDREMTAALAKHEKTYIYGLGLKLKACQKEDDSAGGDLIKAEMSKVTVSANYFSDMMLKAKYEPESFKRERIPAFVRQPKPSRPVVGPVAAPKPKRVSPDPSPVPVAEPPKIDESDFLAHARSMMVKRCGPDIVKRDEALKKNLADFKSDATKLLQANLDEKWHEASQKELGVFIEGCVQNGNRMGAAIETPLKHKKFLIPLHDAYQAKEATIDREMSSLITQHEKTYLHGLGLKLKASQNANDTKAVALIQAEMNKVDASKEYFSRLMLQLIKKN